MLKYVIKRILLMIPTMLIVTMLVYFLINITPVEPARIILGTDVAEEQVIALNRELGFYDPLPVRYFNWLKNAVRGDFGNSYYTNRSVIQEIMVRFPYTLKLSLLSLGVAIVVGIPLGVFCATKQYSIGDHLLSVLSMGLGAIPIFWLGLLLLLEFSAKLGWFPAGGVHKGGWLAWVLPTITLALGNTASYLRYTRSVMLDSIRQDYIRTARAKGCSESAVTWKHAFRNSTLTLITITGTTLSGLMGGAIVVEQVFTIPGLGVMTVTAIQRKDIPEVMGALVFLALFFLIMMLIVDLLYAVVDPRLKGRFITGAKKAKKKAASQQKAA
ncbi:MAG: ABC transporter permease [Lachnospiraceae bacterium]|nr:ABC transporter permease [Lachnospiraceae bacterium]